MRTDILSALTRVQLSADNLSEILKHEGPRALDHSPESWHIRLCFGLCLKRYRLKIFLFSALVAMLFN